MDKILFPTDFSETANNAFVYVLEMAKTFKAEVIVLHVYDLPPVSYEGYPIYVAEIYDTLELDKFENFRDQIPFLRKIAEEHHFESVQMSHVLEQGDLVLSIKNLVKKEKINFIVMGTNGASGFKQAFLGSNTGSVIANVPETLMCIPSNAKYDSIQKLAFTTRFRTKDHAALKQVVNFANKLNAKVKCLYVRTSNSDIKDGVIEKWRADFQNDPVAFFIVPDNDVEGTVFEFLKNQEIDVLCMLTYKRTFFQELFKQSFAKKLSYHSDIPLLVFHEK